MFQWFNTFADIISRTVGRPLAFIAALGFVIVWALSGPYFQFSDTWQLVVNTSTTIVTFLMVFLLQHSQNRDGLAIQAKLDALIKHSQASNRYIRIETSTPEEIEAVREQNHRAH